MRRGKNKIIVIVMMIIASILSFVTISYGFGIEDLTGTQPSLQMRTIGHNIFSIVTAIGAVVSVVMLIILGIKYMMGSTAEKAEYKKTLVPYAIGAGLVFSASSIAQLIYNVITSL